MKKDTTSWDPSQIENLSPADPGHSFLNQMNARGLFQNDENIIVPIVGPDGKTQGCQTFFTDGSFKFSGKIAGGFHVVGEEAMGRLGNQVKKPFLFVCENLAAADTLNQATGQPAYVAFTTGNLEAVTQIAKKRNPGTRVILDRDLPMEKGMAAVKKVLENPNEIEPCGLECFSMYGLSKEMEEKMMNDVYIMGNLAIMGQSTVFFAQYNVGKTLMVIFFLIQAIKTGTVKGESVFFINADDTFPGLVHKLKIAEKWGFHLLAPGHGPKGREFKADQLTTHLNFMIQTDDASGKVVVLDTVKKFTDLMSKDKSSKFNDHIRQFISHGGTVIMLAHVNKHRDENKKVVYEGTSDLVSDSDCAYTIDVVTDDIDGFRTIRFDNLKSRGAVVREAFYKYDAGNKLDYFDRLASVTAIDEDERQRAEQQRAMENKLKKNRLAVDAIIDCIREGITTKTELIALAAKNSGISKKKITKALLDHTGSDVSKNQFWYIETGEHNVKNHRLNYGVEA